MSQSKHPEKRKQLLQRPTGGKKLGSEQWKECHVTRGKQRGWGVGNRPGRVGAVGRARPQ